MMNVLAIAQGALDEMGLPVPTSIVSTTNDGQRQLKALMQSAARFLRSQRTFAQQKKTHSFDLEASRYQYVLPVDYYAALPGTAWDDDKYWRLLGPMNDSEWTEDTKGLYGDDSKIAYRIFGPDFNPSSAGGQFMVKPTPSDAGETLSYEYITRYMFVDVATYASFTETITLDTDLCIFDDDLMVAELKWRYLRAKKRDYAQELEDAKAMLETAAARFQAPKIGSFEGRESGARYSIQSGSWTF